MMWPPDIIFISNHVDGEENKVHDDDDDDDDYDDGDDDDDDDYDDDDGDDDDDDDDNDDSQVYLGRIKNFETSFKQICGGC